MQDGSLLDNTCPEATCSENLRGRQCIKTFTQFNPREQVYLRDDMLILSLTEVYFAGSSAEAYVPYYLVLI